MNKCPYIVGNECDIDRCNAFFDKAELLDRVAEKIKDKYPKEITGCGMRVTIDIREEIDDIIEDMKAEVEK